MDDLLVVDYFVCKLSFWVVIFLRLFANSCVVLLGLGYCSYIYCSVFGCFDCLDGCCLRWSICWIFMFTCVVCVFMYLVYLFVLVSLTWCVLDICCVSIVFGCWFVSRYGVRFAFLLWLLCLLWLLVLLLWCLIWLLLCLFDVFWLVLDCLFGCFSWYLGLISLWLLVCWVWVWIGLD